MVVNLIVIPTCYLEYLSIERYKNISLYIRAFVTLTINFSWIQPLLVVGEHFMVEWADMTIVNN